MTASPLDPWPAEALPPGVTDPGVLVPAGVTERPARLGELLPVGSRNDTELAAELQRVVQIEAQLAAYKVELVAELAAHRPDSLDVPCGRPGAAVPRDAEGRPEFIDTGTSEFFADELAVVLSCSRTAATTLIGHAFMLLTRLRATWEALADARLDWPRARALAGELAAAAGESGPAVVAEVEAAMLAIAGELSVRQLQTATRRELIARDAAAAERRRARAEKAADVTVRPTGDGMGESIGVMPLPLAAAIRETVDGYAWMAREDGDPRPLGQLRVAALADLVLRPWDTSRPPVTAALTVIAPLPTLRSDPASPTGATGEVNGQPITRAQLRVLLEQVDSLCPGGLQAPAGGSLNIALVDAGSGELRATVGRRDLQRLVRRGCPAHPGGDCGCSVLDRPPPVDRYEPTPAQRRFVKTRDRTCRHPGCANRAGWADLDHVIPHACGGPTDCANLCCLCRRHHRLKTHARGWRFTMAPDGTLSVTTPSGVTRTTRPPGLHHGPPADPPPFSYGDPPF